MEAENQFQGNAEPIESSAEQSAPSSEDIAPESSSTEALDLGSVDRFTWEGKEWTRDEFKNAYLRQQDYTRKTQALAEERRRYDEERRNYLFEREQTEKYESNLDADIENVLRDPSLESKFKEIYPPKYHARMEQALNKAFGDVNSPKRQEALLSQRLNNVESRFHQMDVERQRQAFEVEVSKSGEILTTLVDRLSSKYPKADEDAVLARAQMMSEAIPKDSNFQSNFSKLMENLYKENNAYHEGRYKEFYKAMVQEQKQANTRARDIGRGGQTAGNAPEKMALKDVKNHILAQYGQ